MTTVCGSPVSHKCKPPMAFRRGSREGTTVAPPKGGVSLNFFISIFFSWFKPIRAPDKLSGACASYRGVNLCSVNNNAKSISAVCTSKSNSTVCITPLSQSLRCASQLPLNLPECITPLSQSPRCASHLSVNLLVCITPLSQSPSVHHTAKSTSAMYITPLGQTSVHRVNCSQISQESRIHNISKSPRPASLTNYEKTIWHNGTNILATGKWFLTGHGGYWVSVCC